ncbi:MAG: hypothetical protein ABJC33_03265 [Betaproteobacteria bacterium]
MNPTKTIVIVGGVFAGTTLARALDGKLPPDYRLLLISEESHTTFSPMLPEALGASIFPEQVVAPIRQMLHPGHFVMGHVSAIDIARKTVLAATLAGESMFATVCGRPVTKVVPAPVECDNRRASLRAVGHVDKAADCPPAHPHTPNAVRLSSPAAEPMRGDNPCLLFVY